MTNPFNPTTSKSFTGKNIQLLIDAVDSQGWNILSFATFKQWQTLGFKVIKGSKGVKVMRANFRKDKKATKKKDEEKLSGFTPYYVFNISQVEKVEAPEPEEVGV